MSSKAYSEAYSSMTEKQRDIMHDLWMKAENHDGHAWNMYCDIEDAVAGIVKEQMPPAQPNLSEAYSKAVFTWLMDYQIRAAELKGRYTPYEVLSWVINDWRKENG